MKVSRGGSLARAVRGARECKKVKGCESTLIAFPLSLSAKNSNEFDYSN